MKDHLAIVCLILALACQTGFSSEDYGFADTSHLQKKGYVLEFVSALPDKNHWKMGQFRFKWNGNKPIKLWGFGFQKDGSFRVRFEGFSRFTNDEWKEVPVGYCGTGAEMFTLQPDRDYTLLIPLWLFQTEGDKGIVKIDGENISLISGPFDTTALRNKR